MNITRVLIGRKNRIAQLKLQKRLKPDGWWWSPCSGTIVHHEINQTTYRVYIDVAHGRWNEVVTKCEGD